MTRTPTRLFVFSATLNLRSLLFISSFALLGITLAADSLPCFAQVPAYLNVGPDESALMDFAQVYLDTTSREQQKNAELKAQRQHMVDIGQVSALDLDASNKAIEEFNRATTLMKGQNFKEAVTHLQKAVAAYPKFVSAYNALGLAYLDQQDSRAKDEFETAAKLDQKFPGSFLNLGMLALQNKDYGAANSNLEKAATLSPKDPKILFVLAYAENSNHEYKEAMETAQRVHALDHHGMANVHYVAASAALGLSDMEAAKRELTTFLTEDPSNPQAPDARKNLDAIENRLHPPVQASNNSGTQPLQPRQVQTFPNSDRLKSELSAVGSEAASATEPAAAETNTIASASTPVARPAPLVAPAMAGGLFTIRKAVDEAAVFFAVSHRGHMINDLELSDIQIRDDNKAPERVLQFSPQSKLPLRLGLLIDTSGSVEGRFAFEKHAAEKFLEKVLNPQLDLGFVVGFSTETDVTQDFTADSAQLSEGIKKLGNGGGTSIFDAVAMGSWKLAAYPDTERVARVLVILSDGEDNSSHHSLKQAIAEAERAGVTIYTVSTAEKAAYTTSSPVDMSTRTDADKVLEMLSERSGGESLFPGDLQTLNSSLDKLRDLIRSRYLVVYKPADFEANGKFRPIRIAAQRKGERMQVHVRKGYNARVEAKAN